MPVVDLEELLFQMKDNGEFINVTSAVNICRDPKDNFLLSLSKDGKASHLITGDKDLLDLKKIGRTQIVTLKKYLSENYKRKPVTVPEAIPISSPGLR